MNGCFPLIGPEKGRKRSVCHQKKSLFVFSTNSTMNDEGSAVKKRYEENIKGCVLVMKIYEERIEQLEAKLEEERKKRMEAEEQLLVVALHHLKKKRKNDE